MLRSALLGGVECLYRTARVGECERADKFITNVIAKDASTSRNVVGKNKSNRLNDLLAKSSQFERTGSNHSNANYIIFDRCTYRHVTK